MNPQAESEIIIAQALRAAKASQVLIAGLGLTGEACVRAFGAAGYAVTVVDESELPQSKKTAFAESGVRVLDRFRAAEKGLEISSPGLIISSPGIDPRGELGRFLRSFSAPVLTDFDIGFFFLGMPSVGVTGTNGKTTAVNLLSEMLIASGKRAEVVGNVGVPFIEKVPLEWLKAASRGDFHRSDFKQENLSPTEQTLWVAEFSSYQLETMRYCDPEVSVLLNLDDDHLERHGSLAAYLQAKERIFTSQSAEHFALVNADEPWSELAESRYPSKVLRFSTAANREKQVKNLAACWDRQLNEIHCRLESSEFIFSLKDCKLLGEHNKSNLAACALAALLAGASREGVQTAINNFTPLAHRIEPVESKHGLLFINDSKGTNVSAVVAALSAVYQDYPSAEVVLLVGGKIKEGSWKGVREKITPQVKAVIGFGADGLEALKRLELEPADSPNRYAYYRPGLEEAVELARTLSRPGGVILLSPGCASFDAYSGYAARGEHFKALARA